MSIFVTILIFIVILAILVFVHEFGHFIVAKKSGMQVEEFGFGFPPRLVGLQKIDGKWKVIGARNSGIDPSKTVYSINWLPLGGFVRILGENNENENHPGSFINKGFWPRFLTLIAGVCMNVILAWLLLSFGFIHGLPSATDTPTDIPAHSILVNPQIGITDIEPGLPAANAGIQPGDVIVNINGQKFTAIADIQSYIKSHAGSQVNFEVLRGNQDLNFKLTPNPNPAPNEGEAGVELGFLGNLKFPWYYAFWEGAVATWGDIATIVTGLYQLVTGQLGFAAVGGPIAIAQLVGTARQSGFFALVNLTIMLSLTLAVMNILPFPALDGGRVLFLVIEKIRRKKNNQQVEQFVNTAGFIFLILLILVISVHDVLRIVK